MATYFFLSVVVIANGVFVALILIVCINATQTNLFGQNATHMLNNDELDLNSWIWREKYTHSLGTHTQILTLHPFNNEKWSTAGEYIHNVKMGARHAPQ